MAYTAYESSANSCLLGVESWCRHLTNSGTFGTMTAPTLSQVEQYITWGHADVVNLLVRYGYGTATPTTPAALEWLEKMNALRACMNIEMSYPITEWGQPNERMAMFKEQWEEGKDLLASGNLGDIGLTVGASGSKSSKLAFTGTSFSRKESRKADTDRVAEKFTRGFGNNPRERVSPRYDESNNQP